MLKKFIPLVLSLLVVSVAEARVNPLLQSRLFDYLVSAPAVPLSIYILRSTTPPAQVTSVITDLEETFTDPRFNSHCEATLQVIDGSYVPHRVQNDSKAFGVLTAKITHTCPSALSKLIKALDDNIYIDVQIPRKTDPSVVISN